MSNERRICLLQEVEPRFIKELQNILNEFAEKKNIDIILSSNQILIGRSSLDVTNDILKIVNDKIKNFKIN